MTRRQKALLSLVFLSLLSFMVITIAPSVRADSTLVANQEGFQELNDVFGGAPADIRLTVAKIITIVLGFLGIIFIGLTVFSGFQYMTSAGNEEKTKKAVDLLKNAIIGLIIILAAWTITRYAVIILSKTVNGTIDYLRYQ